jgi:antitoxin component YwqK of YwqJK toxin-antitoxin module
MARTSRLTTINVVEFHLRQDDEELLQLLAQSVSNFEQSNPSLRLTSEHGALRVWGQMSLDVLNGGFKQFFFNNRGERGVDELASLLGDLELSKEAIVVREAVAIYRKHRESYDVDPLMKAAFTEIAEFNKLDLNFGRSMRRCCRALGRWARERIQLLATDERGRPINPTFTGIAESKHPNGALHQRLEVKNGKPHGAFRSFFDDGAPDEIAFYKTGKRSGDFWPDGTPMRREFKRGKEKFIEWYFPSGKLQKRMVLDKDHRRLEPVRLYHENGQVAEELTIRDFFDERGPWLRYFEDGSPKLIAEHRDNGQLVVHDAWDDSRCRIVTGGTGTFSDDHTNINNEFGIAYEHDRWDVYETVGGVPHGTFTIHREGVVQEVAQYEGGLRHGRSTEYWDNGRVRCVRQFDRGKVVTKQEFPKFDVPNPAVRLDVRADKDLYTGWKHRPVDEYPVPLNLEEVRKELVLPKLLHEIHQKNRAGAISTDYENCNTFEDSIGFFVELDDQGNVVEVQPTAGGVFTFGLWPTYVPLLQSLKFTPGRARGRSVKCRVFALVTHTFIEGAQPSRSSP